MLRAVEAGAAVVVCSTCRASAESRQDAEGRRGGELLAEAMREVQWEEPDLARVEVQEMPCLFACKRFCTVHIRAPGKVGYVLGDFAPGHEAARAILTYAARHAASEDGVVRYAEWPEGVKGHFIVRTPPEGYLCT
jgi:predicted metal-binding protein